MDRQVANSLTCDDVEPGEHFLDALEDDNDVVSVESVLRARIRRHQREIQTMGKYRLYFIHSKFIFVKGDF